MPMGAKLRKAELWVRLDIPYLFHNNALRCREPGMVPPKIR